MEDFKTQDSSSMKGKSIINRAALRRAFLGKSSEWQTGRVAMPRALVAACEQAVAMQVLRFASESKVAGKSKINNQQP